MPLSNYGVLRGLVSAIEPEADGPRSPHLQVRLVANGRAYVAAVNVKSRAGLTERDKWLLFYVSANFRHPITQSLLQFAPGFHRLPTNLVPGLDYIRQNLVRRDAMRALPPDAVQPDEDDLNDALHFYLEQARRRAAECYVFGQAVEEHGQVVGMHDIHLNQGNDPRGPYAPANGVFQDGALLIRHRTERWVALLLAFQAQAWHTDDVAGHPLTTLVPARERVPEGAVRIVAARFDHNPTVTILNAWRERVNLVGWHVRNALGEHEELVGVLYPGETHVFPMAPYHTHFNHGYLSLLDPHGWKVDGVSYTSADIRPGGMVVF